MWAGLAGVKWKMVLLDSGGWPRLAVCFGVLANSSGESALQWRGHGLLFSLYLHTKRVRLKHVA